MSVTDEQIQADIEANRRSEWLLIPKALVGLVVVAAFIVVRQVFFA